MVTMSVVLKPCPWCRKTPELNMPLHSSNHTDETWCWCVRCENGDCLMNPKSPHVALRRTTKTNILPFCEKIRELADSWNAGNPFKAYEKKVFDYPHIDLGLWSDAIYGDYTNIKAAD